MENRVDVLNDPTTFGDLESSLSTLEIELSEICCYVHGVKAISELIYLNHEEVPPKTLKSLAIFLDNASRKAVDAATNIDVARDVLTQDVDVMHKKYNSLYIKIFAKEMK